MGGVHIYTAFCTFIPCLTVLVHELGVELDDALNPVGARGEEGCAEVETVLLLTEAGARDDANTGGVQQSQAVELIGSAALGGGGFDGLSGEVDSGEEVHGTLLRLLVNVVTLCMNL